MRTIAIACLCAAALCSCIGIDTRLTIRGNGSGSLLLDYRVSRSLAELGAQGSSGAATLLPIERSDFERAIARAPGVSLRSYRQSSSGTEVRVRAELAFDSVEHLAGIPSLADAGLSLASVDGTRTLTQTIHAAPSELPGSDALAAVEALFNGYEVGITVVAPAPITRYSLGTLSADGRTLSWRATVPEIVRTPGAVVLTMSW